MNVTFDICKNETWRKVSMLKLTFSFLSVLFLIMLPSGCADSRHDSRLEKQAATIPDNPKNALDSLQAIDPYLMSASDRTYRDLLIIKARDKAYIRHSSDSVILKVLEYYNSHKSSEEYPEVLYYAGRVYLDLGDYPTALNYFQQSMDIMDDMAENLQLKGNILSQMSGIYSDLRLYDDASLCIQQVLELDKKQKDSVNQFNDALFLAGIYKNTASYDKAEMMIDSAMMIDCSKLNASDKAFARMNLAAIKYFKGSIDSAVMLIRDVPEQLDAYCLNEGLSYACEIYRANNKPDTAIMYARQLMETDNMSNKRFGYKICLSIPEFINNISKDSLSTFVLEYKQILEDDYDENIAKQTFVQNARYNYQTHLKKQQETEAARQRMVYLAVGLAFVLLFVCVLLLYVYARRKNAIIELQNALENIRALKDELDTNKDASKAPEQIPSNPDVVKERLKEELLMLYRRHTGKQAISTEILQSPVYAELQDAVRSRRILSDDDVLWGKIESAVKAASPQFMSKLSLLAGGKLSVTDIRTAMLVKCGVSPTDLTYLLGRSKGAISSRRATLCMKLFDKKLGTSVIDAIIRAM